MVLDSPGPLLTPPPSSSPPKTPIRSYSAQTPPRTGNPTPPPPGGRGGRRRGRDTGDQNGPQADADALRHPRHSDGPGEASALAAEGGGLVENDNFAFVESEKEAVVFAPGLGELHKCEELVAGRGEQGEIVDVEKGGDVVEDVRGREGDVGEAAFECSDEVGNVEAPEEWAQLAAFGEPFEDVGVGGGGVVTV